MKKINDELTALSIRTLIPLSTQGSNANPDNSFSSLLNQDNKDESDTKQSQSYTNTQEQILNKEAYLNKMMIHAFAS